MTNHIELMMRTAGVELIYDCMVEPAECKYLYYEQKPDCDKECDIGKHFPDFTAEKQLEIIRFLGNTYSFGISGSKMCVTSFDGRVSQHLFYNNEANIGFTQALAQLTTELMNANELDKSKVKEILQ